MAINLSERTDVSQIKDIMKDLSRDYEITFTIDGDAADSVSLTLDRTAKTAILNLVSAA